MLQVVKDFEDKGIKLISLRENIDISTVTGRCFLSIMGAIAQMGGNLKQNEPLRAVRQRKRAVVRVGASAPIRISFNKPALPELEKNGLGDLPDPGYRPSYILQLLGNSENQDTTLAKMR